MAAFLVFDLYGPLASWGEIAVGEVRPTRLHPGRSAILGLLGAALGIERTEEARHREIAASVGVAVRLDGPGVPLRDYHTVQVPSRKRGRIWETRADELEEDNLNTILSQRDYRCDAFVTVFLWQGSGKPAFSLEELRDALQRPRFPLYLGRKSCVPALPLHPRIVDADTLREAAESAGVPSWVDLARHLPGWRRAPDIFWEASCPAPGFSPGEVYRPRDEPLSRVRWQFQERAEYRTTLGAEAPSCT